VLSGFAVRLCEFDFFDQESRPVISSLFANILYPLLATFFVVAVEYDIGQPIPSQVAAFGSDLCVLALGAITAVINNPLLVARWGTEATINVGFRLGLFDAILVVICSKIRKSAWPPQRQAKINFALGSFAVSVASLVNIVTYW
jgi:hypothetical protein